MKITEPVLKREQFSYQEQCNEAIYSAELLAKDTKNDIYKQAIYLKSEDNDWWKDKSNFPCMLIANLDGGDALVWVHYCINSVAYDFRDFGYHITGSTNWRRARKEEILNNVKGL